MEQTGGFIPLQETLPITQLVASSYYTKYDI